MPVIALVSTLAANGEIVDSFVRYHLEIGFDRIILFLDKPEISIPSAVLSSEKVVIFRNDNILKSRWKQTNSYDTYSPYVDKEVMARQILNTDVAIDYCLMNGVDWLMHLDIDELFYSPNESVKEHFTKMLSSGVGNVMYVNYEGVPEKIFINDYFKEVTLFKRNPLCLTNEQRAYVRGSKKFLHGNKYFLLYTGHKSAVHLNDKVLVGGVHHFISPEQEALSYMPIILHYPICGFDFFWTKYKMLGYFPDTWFDKTEIKIPFHLEARNIIMHNDVTKAKHFYQREVLLKKKEIIKYLNMGLLSRIFEPSDYLINYRLNN